MTRSYDFLTAPLDGLTVKDLVYRSNIAEQTLLASDNPFAKAEARRMRSAYRLAIASRAGVPIDIGFSAPVKVKYTETIRQHFAEILADSTEVLPVLVADAMALSMDDETAGTRMVVMPRLSAMGLYSHMNRYTLRGTFGVSVNALLKNLYNTLWWEDHS